MKRFLILLDAAPGEPGGNNPPAPATPPKSPAAVQKTPIKTPNEIRLEKVIAGLEDKVGSLEGRLDEVNTVLEGLNVGAPPKAAPVKVTPGKVPAPVVAPTPPQSKGFLHDVVETLERDIWGNSNQN